jgi:hypothetical protein
MYGYVGDKMLANARIMNNRESIDLKDKTSPILLNMRISPFKDYSN